MNRDRFEFFLRSICTISTSLELRLGRLHPYPVRSRHPQPYKCGRSHLRPMQLSSTTSILATPTVAACCAIGSRLKWTQPQTQHGWGSHEGTMVTQRGEGGGVKRSGWRSVVPRSKEWCDLWSGKQTDDDTVCWGWTLTYFQGMSMPQNLEVLLLKGWLCPTCSTTKH
jgi:hypothetical protein